MRLIKTPRRARDVPFRSAAPRPKAAFGDDSLYLESTFDDTRHVEIPGGGRPFWGTPSTWASGTAPAAAAPEGHRGDAARARALTEAAARSLLAGRSGRSSKPATRTSAPGIPRRLQGRAYFIEINCRIQVEHPITEMCTGKSTWSRWQIKIAAGERSALTQADVRLHRPRHRVPYSGPKDPSHDFRPQSGQCSAICPGRAGVRMDTHTTPATKCRHTTTRFLGKLSVWAPESAGAIARGDAACASCSWTA